MGTGKQDTADFIRTHVKGMDRKTAMSIAGGSDTRMREAIQDALQPYAAPLDRDVFMRAVKTMAYNHEKGGNVEDSFHTAVIMLHDSLLSGALAWLCDDGKDLPVISDKGSFIVPAADGTEPAGGNMADDADMMTMAGVKAACKACRLDGDTVLGIVKQLGWDGFMRMACIIEDLTYAEYRLTRPRLGAIIMKASQAGNLRWLYQFLTYLMTDHPVITQPINVKWFEEASQYPFEFYIEAGEASEAYTMDDYNALMDARMTAFAAALTPDTMMHAESMRAMLSSYKQMSEKIRNVNSRNIAKWMTAVDGLKPLDGGLVDGILPRFAQGSGLSSSSSMMRISGLGIFADITFSTDPWIGGYRTFDQGSNATIEYLNAINADGADSAYRWCVWLRAQRALRENRALIIPAKGAAWRDIYFYFSPPMFNHCPPEIIAWLHEGVIPEKLTYDRLGECIMPKDVIGRMQVYPKHYDEWLRNEEDRGD